MAKTFVKLSSGKMVNLAQVVLVEPDGADKYLGICVLVTANSALSSKLDGKDGHAPLQAIEAMSVMDP